MAPAVLAVPPLLAAPKDPEDGTQPAGGTPGTAVEANHRFGSHEGISVHPFDIPVSPGGFVCAVERSWMSPFDDPGFWNPKLRAPICLNPAAARSILPITLKTTELVLSGVTKTQLIESLRAAVGKGELPPLEPGAMSYMMSKQQYLGDEAGHFAPHLMFYVPRTDPASWGADLPGSPVMQLPQFRDAPEPITAFLVPVREWSDGTPRP